MKTLFAALLHLWAAPAHACGMARFAYGYVSINW